MEKVTTAQDDQLLNYLDGKLNGKELIQLKNELEASPLLRARLEELRMVHLALSTTKLETPSEDFVKKVMRNLHVAPISNSTSPRNGLLLLSGMVVAAGILMFLVGAGVFDQFNGSISLEQATYLKKYLPSIPIGGKLIINILVGINLILIFVVLDRTVLRPFFRSRSMQF